MKNRIDLKGWELIGYCCVDSGTIMITDPCYLHSFKMRENNEEEFRKEFDEIDHEKDEEEESFEYSHLGACRATLRKQQTGQLENSLGVVTSTMYGDGEYPVFARKDKFGQIMEVKIVFDDIEEEDD